MAICKDCKKHFESQGEWQKICKDCYKSSKQKEIINYQSKIVQLTGEVQQLTQEIRYLKNSDYNKKNNDFIFDKKTIKNMLILCHPDRHDNSILSNDVTCQLIKLLKKIS